jgi:tryptophan synthase beta chain
VGPQHAQWADEKRVEYASITDAEALAAFHQVTRLEGILPALESAHAVAEARKRAPALGPDGFLVVCLSGRGDKDVETVLAIMAGRTKKRS